MKLHYKTLLLGAMGCAMSVSTLAADLSVEITNLTRGSYFTPLLVAAHTPAASLFTPGTAASEGLQDMAEGGSLAGLEATLTSISATSQSNPAMGLLAPGASTTSALNTDAATGNTHLSIVAMVLPSNDGFVGMNTVEIPTAPGSYTYFVNAYDAGTEANDEVRGSGMRGVAGFPAPGPVGDASGMGATGVSAAVEGFVHIHRGVLGDTSADSGASDIDATVHRWLNPVARVVVTVN